VDQARLVIIATLSLACSTTRYAGPEVTPESVEVVRRENPGAEVRVEGVTPPAADLDRAPRRLSLILVETTPTETIVKEGWRSSQFAAQNREITGLTVTDHARGALQGLGVGALIAGALMGVAAWNPPCDTCFQKYSRLETAELVGLIVGVPVVVLTTSVGALIGARTTYSFQ
jgi:hypothetical protein